MFSYPDFLKAMTICQKMPFEDQKYVSIHLSPQSKRFFLQNDTNLRHIKDDGLKDFLVECINTLPNGSMRLHHIVYDDPLQSSIRLEIGFHKNDKENFYKLFLDQQHDKIIIKLMVSARNQEKISSTSHDIFSAMSRFPKDFMDALKKEDSVNVFASLVRSSQDYPFLPFLESLFKNKDVSWENPYGSLYLCLTFLHPLHLP